MRLKIKDWAGVVVALIILVGCAAAPPHHPSRIEVAGSRNLRDLGGYRTMDGKEVSKGFLTGAMNKHTKLAEGDFRNILPRFTPEAMAATDQGPPTTYARKCSMPSQIRNSTPCPILTHHSSTSYLSR